MFSRRATEHDNVLERSEIFQQDAYTYIHTRVCACVYLSKEWAAVPRKIKVLVRLVMWSPMIHTHLCRVSSDRMK